ncbi:MAG: DNA internalization-related competence protein ComEC/Rec2 [Lachnospiraceae bacterium]|nr:DNA internalization-related competence protein ComEC/Rec2 [Lachnospiraceae bacterium]
MRRPLFAVCLCIVMLIALWEGWHGEALRGADDPMQSESGNVITVTGQVYQRDSQSFIIKSVSIYQEAQEAAVSQQNIPYHNIESKYNIICESTQEQCDRIRLGCTVFLEGTYYDYPIATNPGEFDARAYYRTLGISGTLREVNILAVGEDASTLLESLYALRVHWRQRLYQVFPEREASIMSTMLLGEKEGLDPDVKALYRRNGMLHILSISGLHISIIGMGLFRLLRKLGLPPWAAAVTGSVILVLYGLLTGMSVSACRAIGMYVIRMLAEVAGRTYDMLTSLGILAVVMLVGNPAYLHHQGFLLSFGAVLGITVLEPGLLLQIEKGEAKRYEAKTWKLFCKSAVNGFCQKSVQALCSGLAVSLATLPIQLWFYYEVPVYSLFLNFMILPFMSAVMICGLLVMLVPGTGGVGTINVLILTGYEKLCRWFDLFPFHTWNPGRPTVWQLGLYYGSLLAFAWLGQRQTRKKSFAVERLLPVLSILLLCLRFPEENRVTILDVGQGDGIVLETAAGEVYLVDCGSSSRSKVGKYVLLPYLKYRGIQRIDAVFLTHGDFDHYGGIVELLQSAEEAGIEIGELVFPDIALQQRQEAFAPLFQVLGEMEHPIPVGYLKAGDRWETKTATFTCLHPPEQFVGERNASSQCLVAEFGKNGAKGSILLTGDVEEMGEALLLEELQRRNIRALSVLKVAHHGSRYSTGEAFLNQIDMKLAVISCGSNNRYGHPHQELMERLEKENAPILKTSDTGAITILFQRDRLVVTTQIK